MREAARDFYDQLNKSQKIIDQIRQNARKDQDLIKSCLFRSIQPSDPVLSDQ
jgi:hypothetical protein